MRGSGPAEIFLAPSAATCDEIPSWYYLVQLLTYSASYVWVSVSKVGSTPSLANVRPEAMHSDANPQSPS